MKRIFVVFLLLCGAVHGASTSAWQIVQVNTGTLAITPSQAMTFGSTVGGSSATATNHFVTLEQLDEAVQPAQFKLHQYTNSHSSISGYSKLLSALNTTQQTNSYTDVTNNQILSVYASETNDFAPSEFEQGGYSVQDHTYNPSPTGDKDIAKKYEFYRRIGATEYLFITTETGPPITWTTPEHAEYHGVLSTGVAWTAGTDILVIKAIAVVSGSGNAPEHDSVVGGNTDSSVGLDVGSGYYVTLAGQQTITGNKTFSGTTTLGATTMNGNLSLNGNWLSGDGGNEGVYVNASGWVGLNTNTPSAHLYILATTNGSASSPVVIDSYGGTFDVFSGITFRKARGTPASPSALLSGDALFSFGGRGYGATAFSAGGKSQVAGECAENWTDANQGAYTVIKSTPTNSTTVANSLIVRADRLLAMLNHSVPFQGVSSGSGYIGASNSSVYVWDGGTALRTKISSHDSLTGEHVAESEDPFTGVKTIVRLERLAEAVQAIAATRPDLSQYSTGIITRTSIPTNDWRAWQAWQDVSRSNEISRWTPESGAFPAPYVKPPMPDRIKSAQKQFDYKYSVEAEK